MAPAMHAILPLAAGASQSTETPLLAPRHVAVAYDDAGGSDGVLLAYQAGHMLHLA